ncbi:Ribosomal_S3_C domain-containing protein [Cephalotus follicularis]|uniref:Ribosomal_S3_C domain-containing protein n=1 Tax=Cephalotus follicularis TaxID=3775 RepID=A0A1Q3BTK7_CEPFO|nr:Ribosomal_S3_C domain-containing protein [Cephalotus follicularis]
MRGNSIWRPFLLGRSCYHGRIYSSSRFVETLTSKPNMMMSSPSSIDRCQFINPFQHCRRTLCSPSESQVYQDVVLRSYLGSIRPPTRQTTGFRLGKSTILHFPKRTFIHLFVPRRTRQPKGWERSKPRKDMGRWWTFGKVRPIRCLGEKQEGKEGQDMGKGIRVRTETKAGYDRSPLSSEKNLSKLVRIFKLPKEFQIENDVNSLRKTKLLNFLFQNKSFGSDHMLKRTVSLSEGQERVCPSLTYFVMQYLLSTKKEMHFDPVLVLNHFLSLSGGTSPPGRSLDDKKIRSCIAFLVESLSSTSEKKRLSHSIRLANHLPSSSIGITKSTVSLFPFFGATSVFMRGRDGLGVYNNVSFAEEAREKLLSQLRIKCWNLMGKDNRVMELIDKLIYNDNSDNKGESVSGSGMEQVIKGTGLMLAIIMSNRRIPHGYNSYLNEVNKMQSLVSKRTSTNTVIESVKIRSVYSSASLIAQDISLQLRNKKRSFRSIFNQLVRNLPLGKSKGVEGIRICCSGRLQGAEIARTECGKFGKISRTSFNQKIDYAHAEVPTSYGTVGVKVWVSFSQKKESKPKTPSLHSSIHKIPFSHKNHLSNPFQQSRRTLSTCSPSESEEGKVSDPTNIVLVKPEEEFNSSLSKIQGRL